MANNNQKMIMIFKKAEILKEQLKHEYVGTEHLLLALLKESESIINFLKKYNISYNSFYKEVKENIKPVNKEGAILYTPLLKRVVASSLEDFNRDIDKSLLFHLLDEGEGVAIRLLMEMDKDVDSIYNDLKEDTSNSLEVFKVGTILNDKVDLNEKVVGREKELELIVETLFRKKKNNPLLIGDAGVGKSAIIEELTRRIILEKVPKELKGKIVVSLEMGNLVSGTKYRGEFEERLTNIINELINNNNIILFIDEIHTMINAGAAEGAISAGDILKPYLARGDIKCIGATTQKEYENTILKDKALNRRFEIIMVKEPNEEETYTILSKIKNEYSSYHKVNIDNDTLHILVHLANVYFPNKKNPDKAIELLDNVMTYVRLKTKTKLIKEKEKELKAIKIAKVKELEKGNFCNALKNKELENKLIKDLKKYENGYNIYVTKDDLFSLLEHKNNIIINKKIVVNNDKHLKKIMSFINKNNRVVSILLSGNYKKFIEKIQALIGYEIITVFNEKTLNKMFEKIKYNPSSIILFKNYEEYNSKNIIKRIIEDGLVEHNDEYINFNNSLIIINSMIKQIGFASNNISDFSVDFIVKDDKIKALS